MKLSHARDSRSHFFSLRPLIDRFKDFFVPSNFFSGTDPRWPVGREDERTNLSKYCRQFCALSGDFPQVTASTGGGGSCVWVNISGSGSRPIGQALTAQFHRRTPKEFPRFFGGRCHCAPVFPLGFLSSARFHGGSV